MLQMLVIHALLLKLRKLSRRSQSISDLPTIHLNLGQLIQVVLDVVELYNILFAHLLEPLEKFRQIFFL